MSNGHKKDLAVQSKAKFWKFVEVSESQFLDEVDTGDILLFRGNKANHGLIRAFTGGHFDHAAIAIKDATDSRRDITFLEAVGDAGVTSNSWQRIRGHIGPG